MAFRDQPSTSISLSTTYFMKNPPYMYNLPALATVLPLKIREIILENAIDYHKDFNEYDTKL